MAGVLPVALQKRLSGVSVMSETPKASAIDGTGALTGLHRG